jgi:hypothetical protein
MIFMQILPAISNDVYPGVFRAAAGVQTGAGQVAARAALLQKREMPQRQNPQKGTVASL